MQFSFRFKAVSKSADAARLASASSAVKKCASESEGKRAHLADPASARLLPAPWHGAGGDGGMLPTFRRYYRWPAKRAQRRARVKSRRCEAARCAQLFLSSASCGVESCRSLESRRASRAFRLSLLRSFVFVPWTHSLVWLHSRVFGSPRFSLDQLTTPV